MEKTKGGTDLPIPKVATINDLSGLGKCSLTAAIPILSAMGVQACPLPTAALSNQTGFPSYACVDLSGHMEEFARQWMAQEVSFAGIYSGFLCSVEQVVLVERFIDAFARPGTIVLVDPVLGDDGRFYPLFDRRMQAALTGLVGRAQVITPNLTEARLLVGESPDPDTPAEGLEPIWELAQRLTQLGPTTVVITGVHWRDQILNLGYCAQDGQRFSAGTRRMGGGFSGTGDILASILCGGLVRGESAGQALQRAAGLLEASIAETCAEGTAPCEGIAFEHHLRLLWEEEVG